MDTANTELSASAPAKLILCGEHAVVYGQPAIALPLGGVRAQVVLRPAPHGSGVVFDAPDMGRRWALDDEPDDPLSELAATTLDALGAPRAADLAITLSSHIPIASGMGSGAAVATALVRGLAQWFGRQLPPAEVSALVYASEHRFHGTASGLDNTVVAFERPIWFVRQSGPPGAERAAPPLIEPITIGAPLLLLVGDTGVRSATHQPVGEVRRRWQADPQLYDGLFARVGVCVAQAREALSRGDAPALGALLDQNHALLQQIGVSSPQLDALAEAAREAGALGAKLSGAGWGGVMLALVTPEHQEGVTAALRAAGAVRVLPTGVA